MPHEPPVWVSRLYAATLRLAPARARRRFAAEQIELLRQLWAEERPRGAGRSAIWFAAMLWRALRASLLQHLDAFHRGRRARTPSPSRPIFEGLLRDARYAVRSIRRARWHAATIVCVVALGAALTATVFALIDGVLLKPLPYRASAELFTVRGLVNGQIDDFARRAVAPLDVRDWQAAVPEAAFTMHQNTVGFGTLGVINGPTVWSREVDERFWDVLGVRPMLGGFDPADYHADVTVRPAIISYGLWQRLFGGDREVLGRPIHAGRLRLRVAGVLPRVFVFPTSDAAISPDVLLPAVLAPDAFARRDTRWVEVIARIPDRVDVARGRLERVTRDAAATFSSANPRARPFDGVELTPLKTAMTIDERPVAMLLLAAGVALVGLVVINTGGLVASRSLDRLREFAARRALGATTWDLVRLHFVEVGVLVCVGALLGILAARYLLVAIAERLPDDILLLRELSVDARVIAVVAATALLIAVAAAGLSLRASNRASLTTILGQGAGTLVAPQRRFGRVAFEAGQVALAILLVIGGALFVTSVARAWRADTGYDLSRTLFIDVRLGGASTGQMERILQLLTTLRAVPGVSQAAVIDTVLLSSMRRGSPFRHTGPDTDAGEMIPISSGFFGLTGLRAVDGRLPTDEEIDRGAPVAVVSERVAREYWPGQSPLGQTLSSKRATVTVIAVVRDARFQGLDEPSAGEIYVPAVLGVWTASAPTYLVRATIPDEVVLRSVIDAIRGFDPAASIRRAQDVEGALAQSIQRRRFQAWLFGVMAVSGLVVAGAGILGVTAASTSRRTREMGVRLALGSTREGLVRLLLGEQLAPVLVGLGAGSLAAAWAVRFARASLYELSAHDPFVWASAIAVVLGIAVIGTLVPASRVVRVDPVHALRQE